MCQPQTHIIVSHRHRYHRHQTRPSRPVVQPSRTIHPQNTQNSSARAAHCIVLEKRLPCHARAHTHTCDTHLHSRGCVRALCVCVRAVVFSLRGREFTAHWVVVKRSPHIIQTYLVKYMFCTHSPPYKERAPIHPVLCPLCVYVAVIFERRLYVCVFV